MIDFNKQLRIVDNPMSVIREPDECYRLATIDGRVCVIDDDGCVYRLESMSCRVENVPVEPKKLYMDVYMNHVSRWYDYTDHNDHLSYGVKCIGRIIRTCVDGQDPTYTYEPVKVEG